MLNLELNKGAYNKALWFGLSHTGLNLVLDFESYFPFINYFIFAVYVEL